MARNSNIKGITIEIGGNVQPLNEKLKEVNKALRDTDSELRTIDKLLRLDPTNVTLLAQKQRVLSDAIAATEDKLKDLRTAQEQAARQLERGEIGEEQYRALERQVIATEQSLEKYRNQLKSTERATEEMADATEEADRETKGLSDTSKAAFAAIGAAAAAASAAVLGFLVDSVEETREFRQDLSRLEQNAKSAGLSLEDVSDELDYFTAITNETDSSVESLSNLLQAGFKGEGLSAAVEAIAGAVISFPDTLKIESLADSLQETLATGKATGQYAELLERLGVNLEDFESGLAGCTTEAGRQEYAIKKLSDNGLADLSREYREANRDLIAYAVSQQRYNESLARMAEAVQPAVTALNEIKSTIIDGMTPALEEAGQAIQERLASPDTQARLRELGETVGELSGMIADVVIFVIENAGTILDIITGIGAGLAAWKISKLIADVKVGLDSFKTMINSAKDAAVNAISKINTASMATLIGAIVTVVTWLGTMVKSLTQASEEFENLKEDAEDLADAVDKASAAFEENQFALEGNTLRANELLEEIDRLNDAIANQAAAGEDTAAMQARLADVVAQYNAIVGDQAIVIDEATGRILANNDALDGQVDAYRKARTEQQLFDRAVQIRQDRMKAEEQQYASLAAFVSAYADAFGVAEQEIWDFINSTEDGADVFIQKFTDMRNAANASGGGLGLSVSIPDVLAAHDAYAALSGTVAQLDEEEAQLVEILAENGIVLDENAVRAAAYGDETAAAAAGVATLTEAEAARLIQAQVAGEELSESQQAQLEAFKEKNAEWAASYEALAQKELEIQTTRIEQARNAEERITLDMDKSLAERTEIMLANQEVVQNAQANYTHLMEMAQRTGNEALASYLSQLDVTSQQGMEILQMMAEDSMEGIGSATREFVEVWAQGAEIGMGEVQQAVESGADGARKTLQNELSEPNAEQDMRGIVDAGEDVMDEMVYGIASTQGDLHSTLRTLMANAKILLDGYIPSLDFDSVGEMIDRDIAAGIRSAQNVVVSAANSVAARVRDVFDFSVSVTRTGSGARIRSYDVGGYFESPQIIQIAERRPEFVGAAEDLNTYINNSVNAAFRRAAGLSDIRMPNLYTGGRSAAGQGQTVIPGNSEYMVNIDKFINNTNQDVDTLAARIATSLQKQINRREAVW